MYDRNIHNTGGRPAGDTHGLGWQMASGRPLPEPEDVLPSRSRLQRVATIMAVLGIAAMFAGLVTPWVNQYCPNNTTVDTIGPCASLPMQVALGNGPYQVATPALLLGFWAVPFGGGGFMNFSGFYLATLFGVIVIEVVLAWSAWRLMSPRRKRWTNAVWIYPIVQL